MPVFSSEKRKHADNVLAIFLACIAYAASEWQREIIYIASLEGRTFDLPFYLAGIPANVFWLRDLFVLVQGIALIVVFLALWYWE